MHGKRSIQIMGLTILVSMVITGVVSKQLLIRVNQMEANAAIIEQTKSLPIFTAATLAQYNGADSTKPIYLGFDGLVYDVTAGKSFYQPGGPYHYLAGKDSSQALHQVGGAIVQSKYPVVGKLSSSH